MLSASLNKTFPSSGQGSNINCLTYIHRKLLQHVLSWVQVLEQASFSFQDKVESERKGSVCDIHAGEEFLCCPETEVAQKGLV